MQSATVQANDPWFDTGIQLRRGLTYRIEVPPGQTWIDWFVKCGPEGRTTSLQKLFHRRLRVRQEGQRRAEFFTLIGTIGRSLEHAFIIGAGPRTCTAVMDGPLVCFANDVPWAYWNNRGAIDINVKVEAVGG
jgi:hypothetical protein